MPAWAQVLGMEFESQGEDKIQCLPFLAILLRLETPVCLWVYLLDPTFSALHNDDLLQGRCYLFSLARVGALWNAPPAAAEMVIGMRWRQELRLRELGQAATPERTDTRYKHEVHAVSISSLGSCTLALLNVPTGETEWGVQKIPSMLFLTTRPELEFSK